MADSRYCGNCETDGAIRYVDDRFAECTVCGHQTVTEQDDDLLRRAQSEVVGLDWSLVNAAATQANSQYGQFMPERWLQMFVAAYNDAARKAASQ